MNPVGEAPLRISSRDDQYLARLVKLIPAEVVALYLTFKEVAATWLDVWAWICLVLVIIARAFGTKGAQKSPQVGAVLLAAFSYVLWIYATGGHLVQIDLPAGAVSVAIGVWTFLVPIFYKGD